MITLRFLKKVGSTIVNAAKAVARFVWAAVRFVAKVIVVAVVAVGLVILFVVALLWAIVSWPFRWVYRKFRSTPSTEGEADTDTSDVDTSVKEDVTV